MALNDSTVFFVPPDNDALVSYPNTVRLFVDGMEALHSLAFTHTDPNTRIAAAESMIRLACEFPIRVSAHTDPEDLTRLFQSPKTETT